MNSLDFYKLRLIDESGEFVEVDLKEELAINDDNLEKEMRDQPAKYVYWSSVLERLRLFQESSNLELEALLGELDKEARVELLKEDIKPTKDSVDAYIKRTEKYKVAKEKCNYYDYLVRRMVFIVKSFEQRKDLMQSYGRQRDNDRIYGRGAGRYQEKTNEYDTHYDNNTNSFVQSQHKPQNNHY